MYAQVEKSKENKSSSLANSVAQKKSNAKQGFGFVDNRPEAVTQRKLQTKVIQGKKGGGSHGKHLHFKVTTVTIEATNTAVDGTVTKSNRFVNANHDEDLGKVPSHGQGPAQKTLADANAVAARAVTLAANEKIINVTWNHYTK